MEKRYLVLLGHEVRMGKQVDIYKRFNAESVEEAEKKAQEYIKVRDGKTT